MYTECYVKTQIVFGSMLLKLLRAGTHNTTFQNVSNIVNKHF